MTAKRHFISEEFKVTTWEFLQAYFQNCLDRNISSIDEFQSFLKDLSELESVVSEDLAWRYIRMTCDTANKELEDSYINFVAEIQPNIAPFEDLLNQKIAASNFVNDLSKDQAYFIYFRSINLCKFFINKS
mgnify:FL=1